MRFADRLGFVDPERVGQNRKSGAERTERENGDPGRLSGFYPDAGDSESSVEQHLDEYAAKRVAHDYRGLRQLADDPVVVVDGFVDSKSFERPRIPPDVGGGAIADARPTRHDHLVPCRTVSPGPCVPARRRHPQPVDQDNGRLWAGRTCRIGVIGHGASSVAQRIDRVSKPTIASAWFAAPSPTVHSFMLTVHNQHGDAR
jgi:hypothetical protein